MVIGLVVAFDVAWRVARHWITGLRLDDQR